MSAVATRNSQVELKWSRGVQRIMLPLVAVLEPLALSLWLGGVLVIGAVVAPVAFHSLRAAPILVGNPQLQNYMAGSIVGGSLKVLNLIAITCFLGLCIALIATPYQGNRTIEAGFLIAAVAVTFLQQLYMFPVMDAAQAVGNMAKFDSFHHAYVYLTYVQVLLLLAFASLRNQWRWKTNSL